MGRGLKKPRFQEAAIQALLECETIADAADKIGIGRTSFYRWMKDPKFQDDYRRARREIFQQAVGRLQAGASQAAKVLLEIMNDTATNNAVRLQAAQAVLDRGRSGIEFDDLVEEVEAIKQRLQGMPDYQDAE